VAHELGLNLSDPTVFKAEPEVFRPPPSATSTDREEKYVAAIYGLLVILVSLWVTLHAVRISRIERVDDEIAGSRALSAKHELDNAHAASTP
jgi:hypothetical protein